MMQFNAKGKFFMSFLIDGGSLIVKGCGCNNEEVKGSS
jgi:hypothetical protein